MLAPALLMAAACGQAQQHRTPPDPGNTVSPDLSPEEAAERERVSSALAAVADLDNAGLEARYPAVFAPALSYDPRAAKNLDLVRASKVGLSAAEESHLGGRPVRIEGDVCRSAGRCSLDG